MKRILYPGWAIPLNLYDPLNSDIIIDYGFFSEVTTTTLTRELNLEDINDSILKNTIPNEPCVLIAHSLGALLALRSSQISEHIKAMVIIGGFSRFTSAAEEYPDGKPESGVIMMQNVMKLSCNMVLNKFFQAMTAPSDYQISLPKEKNLPRLRDGLQCLRDIDCRDILKNIKIPVMIVHGDGDQVVSSKLAEYLSEHIPDSVLHLIPDAGHALPFTHTEESVKLIDYFLESII